MDGPALVSIPHTLRDRLTTLDSALMQFHQGPDLFRQAKHSVYETLMRFRSRIAHGLSNPQLIPPPLPLPRPSDGPHTGAPSSHARLRPCLPLWWSPHAAYLEGPAGVGGSLRQTGQAGGGGGGGDAHGRLQPGPEPGGPLGCLHTVLRATLLRVRRCLLIVDLWASGKEAVAGMVALGVGRSGWRWSCQKNISTD